MGNEYVQSVLDKLQNNPTAQDIDFFIEAHARIGYLAAQAQALADESTIERKFAYSTAFASAKTEGLKVTAADAEARATTLTYDEMIAEVNAYEKAAKLKNLLNSVEQAINGIKFLGRSTDVNLPSMRTRV